MAKIDYSALVNRITGKLSHDVLSRTKTTNLIRRGAGSIHLPRTQAQQQSRGLFSDLKGKWYALSSTQKALWQSWASMSQGIGTGLNGFVQLNMRLLMSGNTDLTQINSPPPSPSTPPSVKNVSLARVAGQTTVSWSAPSLLNAYVQLFHAILVGYGSEAKARWSLVQTVRSDSAQIVHSYQYPDDTTILYRLRSLDAYGRISPLSHSYTPTITDTYPVLIDNSANANTLTNYQVKLTIPSDCPLYDNASAGGGNIRFRDADKITPLSYWIESWNYKGVSVFWIKVPSISGSSTKNIYVKIIGSGETTTSSPEDTFVLYDNFAGDTLDAAKWITRQGAIGVSGGNLELVSTTGTRGLIDSIITFSYPKILEASWKGLHTTIHNHHVGSLRAPDDWTERVDTYGQTASGNVKFMTGLGGVYTTTELNIGPWVVFYTYKTIWELNKARLYKDDVLKVTHTTNVPIADMGCIFYEGNIGLGRDIHVDWVRVREYADPEPSATYV